MIIAEFLHQILIGELMLDITIYDIMYSLLYIIIIRKFSFLTFFLSFLKSNGSEGFVFE